jgi:hypothetical protein
VIGPTAAATVLTGYFLRRHPPDYWSVYASIVMSVLMGTLTAAVDHGEALAHKRAAEVVVNQARELDPNASIWSIGYWGFQFYAERAGARPVTPAMLIEAPVPYLTAWPNEMGIAFPRPTVIQAGDWWVEPSGGIPVPRLLSPPDSLRVIDRHPVSLPVPITTDGYYAGAWPLHYWSGPRLEGILSQAQQTFVPAVRP